VQALHRVDGILETAAIGALYAVLLGGPVLALVALVLLGRRIRRRRSERALLARA
jgi:predicted permease